MEIREVDTNGIAMEYIRFGNGARPLVILPGIGITSVLGAADAIAATFTPDFGKTHTVYLFDRKKGITPGYGVEDMAADTAAVLTALGIADADFYGASQGGMIALCLAVRYPELVHGVVAASSAARLSGEAKELMRKWEAMALAGETVALNRAFAEYVYSEEYRKTFADAFGALENVGTPEELARFAVLSHACTTFDLYGELDRVRCPVLAVGSEQDLVLGKKGTEEIADRIGCEKYLYAGYGHAVYDEAPDFRARMAEFFARISF